MKRSFKQNKLWRDKTIDMCEANGSIVHWKKLNDTEFDAQLRVKLAEETEEVRNAHARDELISELADVYEVIDSLCALHGISIQEIKDAQANKNEARGGFAGRKFVTIAEHPQGSFMEVYCLKEPEKYPEIIQGE